MSFDSSIQLTHEREPTAENFQQFENALGRGGSKILEPLTEEHYPRVAGLLNQAFEQGRTTADNLGGRKLKGYQVNVVCGNVCPLGTKSCLEIIRHLDGQKEPEKPYYLNPTKLGVDFAWGRRVWAFSDYTLRDENISS